jgi:hypothetical protein
MPRKRRPPAVPAFLKKGLSFDMPTAELRMRQLAQGARLWLFWYPSGRHAQLRGQLWQGDGRLGWSPCILLEDRRRSMAILDPRALIRDERGATGYHPREIPANLMEGWVTVWLAEHPEWPGEVS